MRNETSTRQSDVQEVIEDSNYDEEIFDTNHQRSVHVEYMSIVPGIVVDPNCT